MTMIFRMFILDFVSASPRLSCSYKELHDGLDAKIDNFATNFISGILKSGWLVYRKESSNAVFRGASCLAGSNDDRRMFASRRGRTGEADRGDRIGRAKFPVFLKTAERPMLDPVED
jgi:hypothetical protein